VVHVAGGSYVESQVIRVRSGETYLGAGTTTKIYSSNPNACAPSADTCAFLLDAGSVLDGLWIEAGSVGNGVFANSTGAAPAIRNTMVRSARKDGVVIFGTGASIGPSTHVNANGYSGLVMRGTGRLDVTGTGNTFDNNQGGKVVSGVFVQGAGILVNSGQLFLDGGATANGNFIGVQFEGTGGSSLEQVVSQLTAQSNRLCGVGVGKGWLRFTLRKSVLTKNAFWGLYLEWNASLSNFFDIGRSTGPGNNVFGGVATKNARAGIMLCASPPSGTYPAEANSWSQCAPSQVAVASCETPPTAYADVAYVPHPSLTTGGANPLAMAMTCTSGP